MMEKGGGSCGKDAFCSREKKEGRRMSRQTNREKKKGRSMKKRSSLEGGNDLAKAHQ